MDEITQDDATPQTKGELTSPLSPKRARTDCGVTDDLTGNGRFETLAPPTSWKTTSFPPETEGLTSPAGCGNLQDGKPPDQSQFSSLTYMATSNSNSAHAGSSDVCFISTERHLVLMMRNEQPPVTEADRLSLYQTDGTGGSPPPASANTPGLPDWKQLGMSPKDETADSCSPSAGNEEDEEVRCQSDCTSKDTEHGTGLCNTPSQFAEVPDTNQREELDFSKAEGESPISSRDYAEFKPLHSKSEEDPSGNLAEGGKNEKNKLELQICENENISICDGETKGQVNESKTFIPSAAECDEGSILSYDVVLVGNIAAEKVSLEVNNHSGADHEESAEGDNDENPFGVIDPAIRSEAVEGAEGMRFDSDGTAGKEKVCEMETPPPLCTDGGTSEAVSSADQAEQPDQQSRTRPSIAENEVHCQSHAELPACSVNKNETSDITGNGGSCQWKSSPLKPPPAGDRGTQESHDTDGPQLKEHSQSSCCPDKVDHMGVGNSQRETDKVEATAEIKEKEEGLHFLEQTDSDKQAKSEEKLELQKEKDEEDTSAVDQSEEETQKPTKLGDELECLCDQTCVTTEREEIEEDINVAEEMRTEEKSEDDVQKESKHKEDASEESTGDWTEGSTLAFCTGDDQEQSLSCFSDHQDQADMTAAENKDQLLPFTLSQISDAVVPCQQDLIHSQNAHHSSPALKCSDRFPPSAFTFCSRVLEGFDTFEKIQLLPDDEDDDEASGLGIMPVHTSLPRQLLKSPQQQLHMPVAKSDNHIEIPGEEAGEEEEVERLECHTGNTTNGFVSSNLTCNEVPNFTPAADIVALGWPEQPPNCGSACESSEHTLGGLKPQLVLPAVVSDGLSSDLSICSEFEMKENFDRVLTELSLFFEISRNDFADDWSSSPEQPSDTPPTFERSPSKCPERLSSPTLGHHRNTSTDDADEDLIMEICGGDSGLCLPAVNGDGEQEVPLHRHPCWETSKDTVEKHKEPREMAQEGKTWSPSFMSLPLLEQLIQRPPEQLRRLEPLKTCTRPIRVGLSRKVKTKHLHSSHPYK